MANSLACNVKLRYYGAITGLHIPQWPSPAWDYLVVNVNWFWFVWIRASVFILFCIQLFFKEQMKVHGPNLNLFWNAVIVILIFKDWIFYDGGTFIIGSDLCAIFFLFKSKILFIFCSIFNWFSKNKPNPCFNA